MYPYLYCIKCYSFSLKCIKALVAAPQPLRRRPDDPSWRRQELIQLSSPNPLSCYGKEMGEEKEK